MKEKGPGLRGHPLSFILSSNRLCWNELRPAVRGNTRIATMAASH